MKKWILCAFSALFLSACMDIKLTSELPAISYITLQSPKPKPKSCQARQKIGVLDISARYNDEMNITILDTQSLEVSKVEGKQWITPPKTMLQTMLLQKLENACFHTSIQPLGTQKLDKIIKISLLSLQVLREGSTQSAQIQILYEIQGLRNYKSVKSGILSAKTPLDSMQNLGKAFSISSDEILEQVLRAL